MSREPFPLVLCLLSIVTTSAGLGAAALGIQWGVAPTPGDALPLAWLYVHLMLACMWLIAWPALALQQGAAEQGTARGILWQALAIAIGALPTVLVAGFVAGVSPNATVLMLALQCAMAALMWGILACHRRFPGPAAAGVGLVAGLTLAGPIATFLATQFFPRAASGWAAFLPLMAVGHAARGVSSPAAAREIWMTALAQGGCGILLLGLSRWMKKAPGTGVPRA